ncbi:MAG: tetratricopeptide repeat protein [Pseudomonadales bacterium]|nr:tetratricopeptide repeat protein [Pseudomonadales bacterium]
MRQKRIQALKAMAHLLLVAMVASCATTQQQPAKESPAPTSPAPAVAKVAEPAAPKQPGPDDYPVVPFGKDNLYQLLVAEFAGFRGELNTALQKYIAAAISTRDPGVAERATRLAAYLQRPDDALIAAEIWASADPDSLDAHRNAAELLMKQGDLETAITHMEAVKRLGGLANFEVFAYQAENMTAEGRQALLVAINRMLETYPDDEQLLFSKAVLIEQNGDLEEALVIANQLLENRRNINVVILKINALKDLMRTQEAVDFMAEVVEELPDNRRLRLSYARLLFEVEDLDRAREQYEIVHHQVPNDADIMFALAVIALEQEKLEDAEGYLQQMVRWNRRAGQAHYYLGSIAEKKGNPQLAIREYRQVGMGYEYLPAHARIANLMIDQGRLKEARFHLQNERSDHPEQFEDLVMVEAQILDDRGFVTELFDFMDEQIDADPTNTEFLYYRAMAGERHDRLDILERDLKRIIDMQPDNAEALNALGYTLADRTDRHEEALGLIEQALALKPDEPAFIDSMGWVQYRLNNLTDAVKYLRQALSLFQNDEVAAHLGEVLWMLGEESEALEVWKKALEQTPDSDILKGVMQRLLSR